MLLVDDDASMRRALVRTIGLAGFEVEAFASAETLLARGVRPDDACLVLDIDLPGMDGIECKRTLDAAGRCLPTVFVTALTSADVGEPLRAPRALGRALQTFQQERPARCDRTSVPIDALPDIGKEASNGGYARCVMTERSGRRRPLRGWQ